MGWRELCVKEESMTDWLLQQVRGWLLVAVVGWMAGWLMVDYALAAGYASDMRVAALTEVEGIVRG